MTALRIIQTGFINFFAAAVVGVILRLLLSGISIPFVYQNLLHAHSHTAILGWCSQTVLALLCLHYLPQKNRTITRLFAVAQIATVGMLIAFILQGYALFSIFFSTLHLIISLTWAVLLLKSPIPSGAEKKLIYTALGFLFLAALGIIALPLSLVKFGKGSEAYLLSVQFYLHFMFNGWLFFGPLALLLILLKKKYNQILTHFPTGIIIPYSFVILISFGFNISWFYSIPILYHLHTVAVVLQILLILWMMIKIKNQFTEIPMLLRFSFICLSIKVIAQSFLVFPEFFQTVPKLRSLHIGFIHLLMLGMVSSVLVYIAGFNAENISSSKVYKAGIVGLLSCFVATEGFIFYQGLSIWIKTPFQHQIQTGLLLFSLLLVVSIGMLAFAFIRQK